MSVASIRERGPAERTSSIAVNQRRMCRDASNLETMPTTSQVRANWRALRLLVVDGRQDTVNACAERASQLGHTACLAFDGFAALRVAVAYRPDVVLLDQRIALIESCQIATHLRFEFPRKEVWIIAVAGPIDDDSRNKCIDAGIDILLTTPVDFDIFETLLMLEFRRVNWSEPDDVAALTGEESIPVRSRDNIN